MRGKGEGAIYKDARGFWTAAVELPRIDGDRRRKVIRSTDKATVIRKLTQLRTDLEKNLDLPTDSQTVEQWFGYWLRMTAKTVRPDTLANYTSLSNNHVVPTIGKVRLAKVTPAHIRRVHEAVLAKDLSSTTASSVHAVMSTSFAAAEREGRISRNPARLTPPPRRQATDLEVLTVKEASALIQMFGESEEAFLWATFLLTGARRGEILGLQWDRVSDVLDLSWQLQRHPVEMTAPADYEYQRLKGGLYLTRPKSKAGWRVIPLVDPLKSILERWHAAAQTNAHGLVFATPEGEPIDPDWATHQWPKVLRAAKITKKVRLHDLRHGVVDLLYEAGVPEPVIMEIVGHSTRMMTRAYKSRGNRPQLTDAMTRMSALLALGGSTADSPEPSER